MLRTQRSAIRAVADGEVAPDTGSKPAGQAIWQDDTHTLTGLRFWVVLGEDGWLYHLTYDGSDGAA